MSDNEKSLSDEATLQGEKTPVDERSLGDRSTYLGSEESSLSDAAGELGLNDHDMEIVDLSKRYRIEKSLGKGGMGEVLLATDTRLDRQVAIKRIRADVAVGKTAAARFLQEAKAVASLSHPNIVSMHDYGRDAGGPFLIMEYVSGGSLLQRCKQGPIELDEAINLACQLCDGLGRAHDAGIIHRDIKPANILLTNDGIPKLTDFGLAKADSRDHTITMAGAVLGTLDFMPPEQRRDASLTDSRSDLWSLAASLYQVVTGEPPRVIDLDLVPEKLRKTLSRALKTRKEDRFQTAAELGTALQAAKGGKSISATELDEGQCASCYVNNPLSRKFCKECAAPLTVSCLKCEEIIPVWEKVCDDCGGKQKELLESRLQELQQQQTRAKKLREDHAYEASLEIVIQIASIDDVRLSRFMQWANQFLKSVRDEWEQEKNSASHHFREAKKYRETGNCDLAIQEIQLIPVAMRCSEVTSYLQSLEIDRIMFLPPIRNSIGMELKLIAPGTFMMGDPNVGSSGMFQRRVTISQPFQLGVCQVTQAQYEQVMGNNPSQFVGPQNPVEQVSWEDAVGFCYKLSALPEEKSAGRVYRLPTEAEWEYACRAGSNTAYSFGNDESAIDNYAWCNVNSDRRTHPVREKQSNGWGLYDMHGNVWEWCLDWYGEFHQEPSTDPTGPQTGSGRVFRGGSWFSTGECCRAGYRNWVIPSYNDFSVGFRVSCVHAVE